MFYRGAWPQAYPVSWRDAMPSSSAARCQPLDRSTGGVGAGAVSIRNCSTAATIAAASSGAGAPERSSILGRGGRRLPLLAPLAAEI